MLDANDMELGDPSISKKLKSVNAFFANSKINERRERWTNFIECM